MKKLCLLTVLALLPSLQAAAQASEEPDYPALRSARARGLTAPYGWFSLVALDWLQPGTVTTVGSAADAQVRLSSLPPQLMQLRNDGGKIVVVKALPAVTLAGAPVPLDHPLPTGEGDADALQYKDIRFWVIRRGDREYLRVKNPQAPARVHFHGLRWYAPNPRYVVQARWVPYTTPHTLNVLDKVGLIEPVPVPGYAEFMLDGQQLRLTPLEASDADGLTFVMRDRTAPRETDGGGRFLQTSAPSNGLHQPGTVTLDFNQARNPPCAYSPYATCPLAPPENRLHIAIPAGEKNYDTAP